MTDRKKIPAQDTMVREAESYLEECPDAHMGAVVVEDGKEKIAMNSTAYVPLFRHPKVVEAVEKDLSLYGVGAGSRYNMGHVKIVRELEERLADLTGTEEAVVFPSGYNLNLGVDSPAFGENPYFIADQRNHPSILSGIRLSAARNLGGNWGSNYSRYISNDMENLESFLKINDEKDNKWILTVGTYGPLGRSADIVNIVALAEKHSTRIFLDDVHYFWVYGPNLCGLTDHYSIRVDILMGSFKAFGMPGAFAVGKKDIISQLRFSEPYIFSIGLLPILCRAALTGIDIIYSDEGRELVEQLWKNAEMLSDGLARTGLRLISDSSTQMVCFRIEGEQKAMDFIKDTKTRGLIVQPYFYPAVPRGAGHVRLTPVAAHKREHIEKTVETIAEAGSKIGII